MTIGRENFLTGIERTASSDSPGRWATVALLFLVLVPTIFNAIALWPELSLSVPSLNDDAFHYLLVQRASEALASGENPFDHWVPELDLGFPQFFYYQHLPHLAVVLLHRLLLKQVDLLTLFNLIRYLLLVGFPLTVYWSMRRLGFSTVAGAVSAAAATLLSSNTRSGFEYDSYVWRGWGLYTQLWAMHLFPITLVCLVRALEKGAGFIAAILSSSMLGLSQLLYAYIMGITAPLLVLMGLNRGNIRARIVRLAVTATFAAVITSYFWFPLLFFKDYANVSPYLQRWKYDSFGARDILTWLVNGDLLDHGRPPALTVLLALGVASALLTPTRQARLIMSLFLFWLALFFGRHTWGRLVDLLPMHEGFQFVRFNGGVHLAALMLIGLGGEWVWRLLAPLPERWRATAAGLVVLAFMVPALQERQAYYALNTRWMERTMKALGSDKDAAAILSALGELSPARTYAGLPNNWGEGLKVGGLHFYNLLIPHRIATTSPQHGSFSLNADLIWHFDDRNPAHYDLFNLQYIVAPSGLAMPAFLSRIKETPRYTLYQAETSGYARFVTVTGRRSIGSQSSLFFENRNWLASGDPAAGRFIRYDYPARGGGAGDLPEVAASKELLQPGCRTGGIIREEQVLPARIDLKLECKQASTVVLKVTYHPNWRVAIDGRQARSFMVSPSFIGVDVPAGAHQLRAEYRSPVYKTALLLLGACVLLATILLRRRFAQVEAILAPRP